MKKIITAIAFTGIMASLLLVNPGCDPEEILSILFDSLENRYGDNYLGWIGVEEEDLAGIEDDINLDQEVSLQPQVDLTEKFPPIGNQGRYGTCVGWSVGYNLRSYLNAVDKDLSAADLANTENQFSPKFLFWAIDNGSKGDDCNGTGFEPAMDVMLSDGIASLADVPYSDLGDCSQKPSSSMYSSASGNKIDNYREIALDVNTLKNYLDDGKPLSIGARLGDNFMEADNDEILSYDTYNYTGQHAYHAMVLAGYDDTKSAFRVINSWDTSWGDDGYIWVDYDFFVDEFCFCAFAASSVKSDPDGDKDNVVDPDQLKDGADLTGWLYEDVIDVDYEDYGPLDRAVTYDVYNTGSETIPASDDWSILYLWYDAYNANSYGILIYDYYSDDYGNYGEDDEMADGFGSASNWWNHFDVPPGESVAGVYFNDPEADFEYAYTMPDDLNGRYYLVLWADGFDDIDEYDETNNKVFLAYADGEPIEIIDGVIQDLNVKKANANLKKKAMSDTPLNQSAMPTVKTEKNRNAYSPDEIMTMLKYHKKSGDLDKKIAKYKKSGAKKNFKRKVKHSERYSKN